MAAQPNWQDLPDPIVRAGDCFRTIERHRLDRMLMGAAYVSAESNDLQHYANVGGMVATAEARCLIDHDEARETRRAWVRMESELRLYRLPPERRRALLLLDPDPGPQRFLTPKCRLRMLREIDDELKRGKRPNYCGVN